MMNDFETWQDRQRPGGMYRAAIRGIIGVGGAAAFILGAFAVIALMIGVVTR